MPFSLEKHVAMMEVMYGKATKMPIKHLATKDGVCTMQDNVQVGDEYYVFLDTKEVMKWGNLETPTLSIERISVMVGPSHWGAYPPGRMPLELFEDWDENVHKT